MGIAERPILIVEDSDADFEAIARCLQKSGVKNDLLRCSDGAAALHYLFELRHEAHERPGIIFLDLNLPGADGREILGRLKSDEDLKIIPVLVLSSSNSWDDVQTSYRNGANTYMQKPDQPAELRRMIDAFRDYWMQQGVLIA